MDVSLYAVSIESTHPIKGGSDVQFNILVLVEHFKNFVWTTTNTVQLTLLSIFGYQHPPSLPQPRHHTVSVHFSDHMHLASMLLSKHGAHRIKGYVQVDACNHSTSKGDVHEISFWRNPTENGVCVLRQFRKLTVEDCLMSDC